MKQIVIIGAGPIGLACGISCEDAALDYVILEKGCLVNSLYHYPTTMTFFSTSEKLEIGNVPFVSIASKPSRAEALEYYRRVAKSKKLNIRLFEKVLKCDKTEDAFEVTTTKNVYMASCVIIATGFYDIPNLMKIPGENLPKVRHYYQDPHFYAFQKIVVVGSNNSAVDVALECFRKGAEVSMVVREPEIGTSVKYWVRPDIENRIAEGEIKAYFNSELIEIKEKSIVIGSKEKTEEIENDWVLAMTGYQPNLTFLESMGINLSNDDLKKPTYSEETMETNIPNVFLAGVICGGMNTRQLFIENSRIHAEKIVNEIVNKPHKN